MNPTAVALDIGGTNIRSALVDSKGRVLKKFELKTQERKGKKAVMENIAMAVQAVINTKIKGIGIGCAGLIDRRKGKVIFSPNVKSLNGTKLAGFLKKRFKKKTWIENEVNCMALGEAIYGKAKNFHTVLVLTLGTGIGGGRVFYKKLLTGHKGMGSEFGHMIIKERGRKCKCGSRGCWEEYLSIRGIKQIAVKNSKKLKGLEPKEIDALAIKGNPAAKKTIKEAAGFLGIGLANLEHIFDPGIIVISGGLSNSSMLIKEGKKAMHGFLMHSEMAPKVVVSALGENAVLVGAACLLFRKNIYF